MNGFAGKAPEFPPFLVDTITMKTLLLLASLCLPLIATAGQLRQWAPGRWTYIDDRGHRSEGWTWAPGRTTWTDDDGHRREVWEWSPGNFEIDDED
jgi:hypothetical protein